MRNIKSYILIVICIILYFSCSPISSSVTISRKINRDLSIGESSDYKGLWLRKYRNDTLYSKENETKIMIFQNPTKFAVEDNYYIFSNIKGQFCIVEYRNGIFYKYYKVKGISKFNKLRKKFGLNSVLSEIKN